MHYEVVNWGALPLTATCQTVPSSAAEHFYGFGEKFNALDQAGRKVHVVNTDFGGDKGDNTYASTPWFVSTSGYGFHLDSTDESWFDMRNQYADRYVISNMVASSFSGYVTNALKYNVVYGPNLTDVISHYTGYKGRPMLPPQWAFMPWMSSDVWSSGGEVRYVITKMREKGIPDSVFVFDSPRETAYNDFTWNTNQFAANGSFEGTNWFGFVTIGDMLTFLRTNGYKVVV
jgi:alpha-D-xyloside xylohydrolase